MHTTSANALERGVWRVDRAGSLIGFRVRHFGVATVCGRFESFACRFAVDPTGVHVEGHVDVASLDTGNGTRDRRLCSEFFAADRYPAITLRATGSDDDRRLLGQLTIRGIARPVALALATTVIDDRTMRACAEGGIRRSDFDLDWDALREAGRMLVSDHVRLRADIIFTRL
jgi:polyisoprenoid-binding protein YceI